MKKILACVLLTALALPFFAQTVFYEGDGGKGLSIEVVAPEVKGKVTDEQEWFPDFAANMIHDNMKMYSAITMVDNINLESQMDIDDRNANSGLFDGSAALDYKAAKNTLFVTLTVTPSGYNLSIRVNEGNSTKASYNQNHSVAEMESGTALKAATAELLEKLGVKLTKEGKESLLAVNTKASQHSIEAQKLYAQGNLAMQKGSTIEALSYFVQANTSDSNLDRAIKSLSKTSATLAAGDLGSQARNAIQQRKQFAKIIEDLKKNFEENPPYHLVFDPNVTIGNIDYEAETINLSLDVAIVRDLEKVKVCNNIDMAIQNAPDSKNWKLDTSVEKYSKFGFIASISDNKGNVLTTKEFQNVLEMKPRDSYREAYFGSWETFTLTIPAETDTSNLVLSIKYVTDDSDKIVNISKITKEDWANKVFVKSVIKEEITDGSGIFIATLPMKTYGSGSADEYNDLASFFSYFMNKSDGRGHVRENYSIKSIAHSAIKENGVKYEWANHRVYLKKNGIPDKYSQAVFDAMTPGRRLQSGNYCVFPEELFFDTQKLEAEKKLSKQKEEAERAELMKKPEFQKILEKLSGPYERKRPLGLQIESTGWNCKVTAVEPNSCAEKAGLQVGDILTNHKPGGSSLGITETSFDEQVRKMKTGETLTLIGKRNKTKMTWSVVFDTYITEEDMKYVQEQAEAIYKKTGGRGF